MTQRANTIRLRILAAFLTAFSFTHPSNAQARLFEDGDRVCFIGDSITHEGAYHSYVYLYYLTRFPEREIRIWNRGISGDSIWSVLRRFDGDIATTEPTISTIMLGMNDVGRSLYGPDKTDEESIRKQEEQLELYRIRMNRLLPKVEDLESEIILITPSIYDQTADLEKPNQLGVNDALVSCSEFIRDLTDSNGYGLIDFNGPMTEINLAQQVDNSTFSIVGADRVHPGRSLGHFIMAYLFLKDQGVPKYVSQLVLDAPNSEILHQENAEITELISSESSLAFALKEFALPYPTTPAHANALSIVPFQEDLNQQILRVQNLTAGTYELQIDEEPIAQWSAKQLAVGVNLATYETPQMRQAHELRILNDERDRLQRELRKIAFTLYNSGLVDTGIELSDSNALVEFFDAKTASLEGKSYQQYFRDQFDAFLELYPSQEELTDRLDEMHRLIYEINQPITRSYSLIRI